MARTPMPTTTPMATNGSALIPVDQDSRLLDVRRRVAQATDVRDRAVARRKDLQQVIHVTEDVGNLTRLEAERDLPGAFVAERDAEIALLTVADEGKATRTAVKAELDAALEPPIRRAALKIQEVLERVAREEYSELLAALDDYMRLTGSGHRQASELIIPMFSAPLGADDTVLRARRRYLTGLTWMDQA